MFLVEAFDNAVIELQTKGAVTIGSIIIALATIFARYVMEIRDRNERRVIVRKFAEMLKRAISEGKDAS